MIYVSRCAWHGMLHVLNIELRPYPEEPVGIQFTDGICAACRDRVLGEMRKR